MEVVAVRAVTSRCIESVTAGETLHVVAGTGGLGSNTTAADGDTSSVNRPSHAAFVSATGGAAGGSVTGGSGGVSGFINNGANPTLEFTSTDGEAGHDFGDGSTPAGGGVDDQFGAGGEADGDNGIPGYVSIEFVP